MPDADNQTPQPEAGESEQRVAIDGGTISSLMSRYGVSASGARTLAADLGLGAMEIASVLAGGSLALTPDDYEAMKATLARSYATAMGQSDGTGGSCGCSGSPSASSGPQTAPVTGTRTVATETNAGASVHSGSVGSGTVTVRTGVAAQIGSRTYSELFTIGYDGPDSQNAHLLQFIWREVVGIHADNSAHPLTGSITTSGGSYQLTDGGTETGFGNPGQSNYNTDTASSSDPFYEAAFAGNRGSTSTVIYDQPYNANDKAALAFAAGATKVVTRAHFITFLVQGDTVTYRVELNLHWVFNNAGDNPARNQTAGTCAAASSLTPTALRQRFHAQFPAYNYIT